MRKLLVLITVILYTVSAVQAQKAKVQTAYNYWKYDELDKAKEAIDDAAANESTSGMAKTWYYRGLIYQKIHKHEKYGSLDPEALMKAYQYYEKALEIDPKYENLEEIKQSKLVIANQLYGKGVESF